MCLHLGLRFGPVADFNHPRDMIKAARDFPDLDFIAYHAGLLTVPSAGPSTDVPWTTEFCQMVKKAGLSNIYMELGSTFGQLVTTNPTACAHLMGQIVDAFGADHVLWGTDLDLVRDAPMADRGIPAVRDPAGAHRQVRLRAADAPG